MRVEKFQCAGNSIKDEKKRPVEEIAVWPGSRLCIFTQKGATIEGQLV
jgi:hypothetical protein